MDTKQLCTVVDHAAQRTLAWGTVEPFVYDDLEKVLKVRPLHLSWGATSLYVDMPDGVLITVPWRSSMCDL